MLLENPASLRTIPHFLKFPEKTFSHILERSTWSKRTRG